MPEDRRRVSILKSLKMLPWNLSALWSRIIIQNEIAVSGQFYAGFRDGQFFPHTLCSGDLVVTGTELRHLACEG